MSKSLDVIKKNFSDKQKSYIIKLNYDFYNTTNPQIEK